MKLYTASSWRNPRYPAVVEALKAAGHQVYDFRNPWDTGAGFKWSDIDPKWEYVADYRPTLKHPIAQRGYNSDKSGIDWAEACVLILPCNRSAHLEAGWVGGSGRPVFILLDGESEPELMYNLVTRLCLTLEELIAELEAWEAPR